MAAPHRLRSTLIPAVAFTAALTLCGVASAQGLGGSSLGTPRASPSVGGMPKMRENKPAEPPAVPGSHTEQPDAAPALKAGADMPPTEALFDAINRGDTPAARDAINRGAELSGKNILGLTPTELSVDLGRNDITFLLLSLRGNAPGDMPSPDSGPVERAAPKPPGRGRASTAVAAASLPPAVPGEPVATRPGRATRQIREASVAAPAPAPAPVQAVQIAAPSPAPAPAPSPRAAPPRQYASDGTAIPQMGFLGFGGAVR